MEHKSSPLGQTTLIVLHPQQQQMTEEEYKDRESPVALRKQPLQDIF